MDSPKSNQTIKFKEIMFKIHKEELDVNGKKLTLETGKVARQADGAIIASLGETVVIAQLWEQKIERWSGLFSIIINYQEKYYAAGKRAGISRERRVLQRQKR